MQCVNCGAQNPDGQAQCSNCGAPLNGGNPTIRVNNNPYYNQPMQQPMQQPMAPHPGYNHQPPRRNNNALLIVIICVLAVILLVVIIGLVMAGNSGSNGGNNAVHDTVVVQQPVVVHQTVAANPKTPGPSGAKNAKNASGADYSWICSTYLTPADVSGKSRSELRIMRNTIYARHGYIFKSADLTNYFNRFGWYQPCKSVVPEREFNDAEKHNIKLIQAYE